MNIIQRLAAMSVLPVAATLIAVPAQAAERPGCPTPSKSEAKRSYDSKIDQPPRGATAIKGVRVGYRPKGFTSGTVVVSKHDGITEYGYQWADNRDDVDPKHRLLWVRVVCWPAAKKLAQLKNAPFDLGVFSGDTKVAIRGGRKVLTQEADGALGTGRYAGWVERPGVVVTVLTSAPLVPQLGRVIAGIRL
ncbi:hypothetical protein [Nonomuraea zeae]|uniref:DUF3558 domain-containing protein n=1 Tax=Nonomuraea zeae TaxID=1642303 RepID=A0A5S4FW44_9ACTN|nr:hypothetical protein [Nonomuraea zeae]TMR24956.1 hypothetical protein ETD85_45885 [Nonomuraea zeae]